MHLVFVTSLVPDGKPATGYEIANAAIIRALRQQGARVTVLGFTWPGKRPIDPKNTVVLGSVDVQTETASALTKVKWLAGAVAEDLTFASAKLRIVSEDDIRRALADIGHVDAYVLNGAPMSGAFEHVFTNRPFVYVAHNVEHLSAAQNAETARSPLQRLLFHREARMLRKLEGRLCGKARFVFTLAEQDREALGLFDDDRSAALPLLTGAKPLQPERTISVDAALIGTWTWHPNRIGLDWFFEHVVPLLHPDFSIAVAGALPHDFVTDRTNVTLVGRVPDAREFVAGGAVVPLISRAGTGVQLKTIETFELGLPSVATSHSLRGVSEIPTNCAIADDPATFARKLEEMAAAVRGGQVVEADPAAFVKAQDETLRRRIALGVQSLGLPSGELVA